MINPEDTEIGTVLIDPSDNEKYIVIGYRGEGFILVGDIQGGLYRDDQASFWYAYEFQMWIR